MRDLDEPLEIKPGVFKPLGACTGREVRAALALLEERSAVAGECKSLCDEISEIAQARGMSLEDLPEGVVERMGLPASWRDNVATDKLREARDGLRATRDRLGKEA